MSSTEPSRRITRLSGYDYANRGAYFVTICTDGRKPLFGRIVSDQMLLNALGRIAEEEWRWIPSHYTSVVLDEFVIMPNHVHGVLMILESKINVALGANADMASHVPTREFGRPEPQTVSSIIGGYKSGVTRRVREHLCDSDVTVWQSRFHDHIIRNEFDLDNHRQYIRSNPAQWLYDSENPLHP